jgi:hypothetical protein
MNLLKNNAILLIDKKLEKMQSRAFEMREIDLKCSKYFEDAMIVLSAFHEIGLFSNAEFEREKQKINASYLHIVNA